MTNTGDLWGIVLAGGSGQRLQPFLKRLGHENPIKQFCAITGDRTMLEQTWQRAERLIPPARVLTVVDASHADIFREQLSTRAPGTVIVQPANRETGPGTLLPLAHVLHTDPEASVVLLPSDHFVEEEERFMQHVEIGAWLARRGRPAVSLLGVEADRPDSEYGWIEVRRAGRHRSSCVLPIANFWEKPPPACALRLYEDGHLWSTMVTVARGASLWALFRAAVPRLHRTFERIESALGTPGEAPTIRAAYDVMPSCSLSKAVFERLPSRLAAIPVRGVHWSDWGREERIVESLARLGHLIPSAAHRGDAPVGQREWREIQDAPAELGRPHP